MKHIEIEDKSLFDKYATPTIINSEYQFSTLFAWAKKYKFSYEEYNDTLYIFGVQNNGDLQCYYPIGTALPDEKISHVRYVFSKNNMPVNLRPLSKEMLCEVFPYINKPFKIGSKLSYADYFYDYSSLKNYEGSNYRRKRKSARSFYKKYGFTYQALRGQNINIAINGLYKLLSKSENGIDIDEWTAYLRILCNFERLNLRGGMFFLGNDLIAISVGEAYFKNIMIHIRRCNKSFDGIYPAMLQMLLINEFSDQNYTYVNLQDDMGNDGVQKAKLSYKPLFVLDKYYVSEGNVQYSCNHS